MTPLQTMALRHLRDADLEGSPWAGSAFEIGRYSAGHRAQINALQSLVRLGFARQRNARDKAHSARWCITEEGRWALALTEQKRLRSPTP